MALEEKPRELQHRIAPARYVELPHELLERLPDFRSLAELQVVLYVLQNTYGFHEYDSMKALTLDEFEFGRKRKDGSRMNRGTGLSRSTIQEAIKMAVEDGFLYEDVDDGDKGRIVKRYAVSLLPGPALPSGKRSARGKKKGPGGPKVGPLAQQQQEPDQRPESQAPEAGTSGLQGVKSDPRVPKVGPRTEKDTLETDLEKDTQKDIAPSARSPIGSPSDISSSKTEEHEDEPTSADATSAERDLPLQASATLEAAEAHSPTKEALAARAAELEKADKQREAWRQAEELARRVKQEEAQKRRAEQEEQDRKAAPLLEKRDALIRAKERASQDSEAWHQANVELKAVKQQLAELGWYL